MTGSTQSNGFAPSGEWMGDEERVGALDAVTGNPVAMTYSQGYSAGVSATRTSYADVERKKMDGAADAALSDFARWLSTQREGLPDAGPKGPILAELDRRIVALRGHRHA